MLVLALALSAALQPPAGDAVFGQAGRAGVRAALVETQGLLDGLGLCSRNAESAGWDEAHDALLQRFAEVHADADELYPDPGTGAAPLRAPEAAEPNCVVEAVRAALARADRALDEATGLIRADSAPRASGLWLGNLRLCGDRVEAVSEAGPDQAGDTRQVIVRFSTAFAPRVRALTAAFVNRRLPVVLDGITVVRATVMEPVSWSISIATPDALPVEAFRRAAGSAC